MMAIDKETRKACASMRGLRKREISRGEGRACKRASLDYHKLGRRRFSGF
jgi:hypothetical protein